MITVTVEGWVLIFSLITFEISVKTEEASSQSSKTLSRVDL